MKYAAELFGTFVLVFAGLTTAVIAGGKVGNVGVAMAFGLSLLAMAFAVGPISGCHINPAVTLGMLVSRRMGIKDAVGYWVAQCIGAIIASAVVLFIASGAPGGSIASLAGAANGFGDHSPANYSMAAAFVAEMFLNHAAGLYRTGRNGRSRARRFCRNSHWPDPDRYYSGRHPDHQRIV